MFLFNTFCVHVYTYSEIPLQRNAVERNANPNGTFLRVLTFFTTILSKIKTEQRKILYSEQRKVFSMKYNRKTRKVLIFRAMGGVFN